MDESFKQSRSLFLWVINNRKYLSAPVCWLPRVARSQQYDFNPQWTKGEVGISFHELLIEEERNAKLDIGNFGDAPTILHTPTHKYWETDRQEVEEEFPSGHFSRSCSDWKHTPVKWRQDIISRWREKGCNLFPSVSFPSTRAQTISSLILSFLIPSRTHTFTHLLSPEGGWSLAGQHQHTMAACVETTGAGEQIVSD